jgi:hypothetical protein
MIDTFMHILENTHRESHTGEILYPRRKKYDKYDDNNVFHALVLTVNLTSYLIMLS